jgi:hypothetical protein
MLSVNDDLRKQLVNGALFDDIIIELAKLHLAKHHLVPFYFDHAIASMRYAATFDLCFFEFDKKLPLSQDNQMRGLVLGLTGQSDGIGLELYRHSLIRNTRQFRLASDFDTT